jgi:hypothetical protein
MQANPKGQDMAKKCILCGCENDDSSLRCACGSDLFEVATVAPPAPGSETPGSLASPPVSGRKRGWWKIGFVLWGLGFVPLYAVLGAHLHGRPLFRCLIGAGIFGLSAVAALWLLGREERRSLRAWRIFFVAWAWLVTPLLLTVVNGIAAEGWPGGRFNKWIAHILVLLFVFTIPAYLLGLGALIRAYRVASALALVTGLTYLGNAVLLFRATAKAKGLRLLFEQILDLVLFGTQMASYLSIPIGVALIVGGVMTFRATRARAR